MVLRYLPWILYLWSQLQLPVTNRRKRLVCPLPDDIVIDILSRLPAESVMECRRVCKQWMVLTMTTYFAEMHSKKATPVVFVQCINITGPPNKLDLLILDEGDRMDKRKMRPIGKQLKENNDVMLSGSCNGVLVFRPRFHTEWFFVCNPVTGEQITIQSPVQPGYFSGLYFHPRTKEFMLLYRHDKSDYCEYLVHSLRSKMWRKAAVSSYRFGGTPTIVNGALHWRIGSYYDNGWNTFSPCGNSIMVYDMDTEDLRALPHPGKECHQRTEHGYMCLFEMKGGLSFCSLHDRQFNVIWVLEDYENWVWVIKYKVNLQWDVKDNPLEHLRRSNPWALCANIEPLNVQNDELLLNWYSLGLFRYHLGRHSFRNIDREGMKKIGRAGMKIRATVCTKSFILLRGFE